MSGEDALIGLRLVQYAGACLLLGVPVFLLTAGRRLSLSGAGVLVGAGAVATASGALLAVLAQTAVMAGSWADALNRDALSMVALHTGLGLSMIVRAAAALAVAAAATLRPGRLRWSAATAFGLIAVGSFAWSGHAGATEGVGAMLHPLADALHAISASIWFGALAALTLICRRPEAARDPATPEAFAAFSSVGTVAVATLALTGLVNAAFLVGVERIDQTLEGAWGRLLVVKLALFAALLSLAASNRWRLTPALARAQAKGEPRPAFDRLTRSLTLEVLIAVTLLAVVAVLGLQPPPVHA